MTERKDKNQPHDIAHPDQIGPHAVGFGKPPMHTRFKPGQSGNPRGRPKHSRNLKTIIQEVLTPKDYRSRRRKTAFDHPAGRCGPSPG